MVDQVTLRKAPGAGDSDSYLIEVQGWLPKYAMVNIGITRCGKILDGIALDLCDCEQPNRCQWHPGGVISFADLEAIYFAALARRGGRRADP